MVMRIQVRVLLRDLHKFIKLISNTASLAEEQGVINYSLADEEKRSDMATVFITEDQYHRLLEYTEK